MKQGTQGRSTARAQLPRQLTAADLSPFMQIFQNLALPYGLRPYRPGRIHPQQTHLLTGGIPARWQEPGLAPAQGRGQSPAQLRRQLSGLFHGAGKILVRSQPADTQPHLAQALRQDMPQHPPRLQPLPDGQIPCQGPDLFRKQGNGLQRPDRLPAGDPVRKIAVLPAFQDDARPQRPPPQGDGHAQTFLPERLREDIRQDIGQGTVRRGQQGDTGEHGTSCRKRSLSSPNGRNRTRPSGGLRQTR